MKTITLDAKGWLGEEDFYAAFLPLVGAPLWHGHNLDALDESIRDGDINQVNVPYRIVITGCSQTSLEFQRWLTRFRALIDDLAAQENIVIELHTAN